MGVYDIKLNAELINADDLYVYELDGAQILNADVVNQNASGTGNDNAVNGDQINNMVDNDKVTNPDVSYNGGNGGDGYDADGGDFDLKAYANSGAATSNNNTATVGDDGSISNANNATSSAAAADREFAQTIATGGNTQVNNAKIGIDSGDSSYTGGADHTPASYYKAIDVNQDLIDVNNLQVYDLDGLQYFNADVVNQNVSGPGNDNAINLDQNNNLVDNDKVENADVTYDGGDGGYGGHYPYGYADGGNHTLYADARSGAASSSSNRANIDEDGSISNAGNATSRASASADSFTQDIATGGNVQSNSADIAIDGGTSEGREGPAGAYRDHVSIDDDLIDARDLDIDHLDGALVLNADVVNQNATGSGNDNAINLDQVNNMVDRDKVIDPNVSYRGGNGGNGHNSTGGDFTVTAVAVAATASVYDNDATVEEDGSISNAANATSSASASAEAFTQEIATGGNIQLNAIKIDVAGGSVNEGEEDCKECDRDDVCDDAHTNYDKPAIEIDCGDNLIDVSHLDVQDLDGLQFLNADVVNQDVSGSGNDNAFNLDQINNLVDNDLIECPTVSYCGGDGGYGSYADGGDFTLYASAASGSAQTQYSDSSVGDGSISNAGNANSIASASAEAFSQTIVMGANVQFNSVDMNIVGGDDLSL
ncbi:hypothetical protein [Bradyrhizobium sp.]|uniref:hypothetical protein n=1 Tax=Bradyrhizobium sp. TaxID=376 RepID=UPI0025C5E78A|nr:hypothetical protein [Bradyrhizobium sp.]